MNLIESKVIQTEFETEIFLDESSHIELSDFHYPDNNYPIFEFFVGVDFIRIRNNEFYGTKKSYFGIKITDDFQSIFIFEPSQQSIFAIKNDQEMEAVKELIYYLLNESPHFRKLLINRINEIKKTNIVCTKEINELKAELELLENLTKSRYEDIIFITYKRK
ncbi:hypothetical protein ACIQAA_30960 [Neobacillus sp. NPDC093182]|uniref:hypothetical protein n=1 Tax=Neobacillus sp. NPDC093182 TaxID=3364297 RepID=UPI0038156CBC